MHDTKILTITGFGKIKVNDGLEQFKVKKETK